MIRKIRTSLTVRIFLSTTMLFLVVCFLSVFGMARYIPQTYGNRLSAELQKQANDLIPVLEKADSLEECCLLVGQFAAQANAIAYIEDEAGRLLYSSEEMAVTSDKGGIATVREYSDGSSISDDDFLGEAGYVFTLFHNEYILYVQSREAAVNQAAEAVWETVPLVVLGIFLISIAVSMIYSRYITRPILELSRTSQKMAQLDFEIPERTGRSDEIGILSENLNVLADSLQKTLSELKKSNAELEEEIAKERELERKQREFFSAASHELKTPLTILKGHLMGMLNRIKGYENQEEYMERSLAVVDKMEALVRELLYVSKTEGKQKYEYKTVDFAELVRVQIANVTELLLEKEQRLEAAVPSRLFCELEPAQMERAIQNILVNAIRYSPKSEQIRICLTEKADTVYCAVENTGVHIPEAALPHLFEAFYRADISRSRSTGGTGLGLYIVRKIMELHQAEYGIQNTADGVRFWMQMRRERNSNSI